MLIGGEAHPRAEAFGLLRAIQAALKGIPTKVTIKWIKAHQSISNSQTEGNNIADGLEKLGATDYTALDASWNKQSVWPRGALSPAHRLRHPSSPPRFPFRLLFCMDTYTLAPHNTEQIAPSTHRQADRYSSPVDFGEIPTTPSLQSVPVHSATALLCIFFIFV